MRFAFGALVALQIVGIALLWPLVAAGNDYVGFVTGARALLAGLDPYDPQVWATWPHAGGQRPDTAVFGYPPWVAVSFIPFALLPLALGSLLWTAGGLALATFAAFRLAARFGWPGLPLATLAFASWPALLVFVQGQWGYLLFALSAFVMVSIHDRRDAAGGAAWGALLLAKPQLFVLASVAIAAWAVSSRRPRLLLTCAAVVVAGLVVGTLAAPGWLEPYLSEVLAPRSLRSTQQPTLAGLAGDVAGEWWRALWVAAVVGLGTVIAFAVRAAPAPQRGVLAMSAVLALSVAAAPYSWSYDHYLVLPLAGVTLAIAGGLRRPTSSLLYLGVALLLGPLAFLLWLSAYARWHDTLAGLVPVGAILLAGVAALAASRGRSLAVPPA